MMDEAVDFIHHLTGPGLSAFKKLEAGGIALGAPHTSQVKGSTVRELRPRRGSSPWRAFYQRIGDVLVIAAIAPEAKANPRAFARGVRKAEARLDEVKEGR
jgi:hypothetical protein